MFSSIVSVHTPKVAGSSFLCQLNNIYGKDNVLVVYDDDPVNPFSLVNIDPNIYNVNPISSIDPYKVVHGHFHPSRYSHLENAFRLTFLRHPIDNIVSIYNFWRAHDRNTWQCPVFQYFKDSNLSLIRFCMLPKIRYLYTHSYFGGFDMAQFNFIGDYKNYDMELSRLQYLLGVDFDLTVRVNTTSEYYQSSIFNFDHLVDVKNHFDELEDILKDDIRFYETYKGR